MDKRFRRLFIVMLFILGIVLGQTLIGKKAPVVSSPADYTEQIDGLNGTPAR